VALSVHGCQWGWGKWSCASLRAMNSRVAFSNGLYATAASNAAGRQGSEACSVVCV